MGKTDRVHGAVAPVVDNNAAGRELGFVVGVELAADELAAVEPAGVELTGVELTGVELAGVELAGDDGDTLATELSGDSPSIAGGSFHRVFASFRRSRRLSLGRNSRSVSSGSYCVHVSRNCLA